MVSRILISNVPTSQLNSTITCGGDKSATHQHNLHIWSSPVWQFQPSSVSYVLKQVTNWLQTPRKLSPLSLKQNSTLKYSSERILSEAESRQWQNSDSYLISTARFYSLIWAPWAGSCHFFFFLTPTLCSLFWSEMLILVCVCMCVCTVTSLNTFREGTQLKLVPHAALSPPNFNPYYRNFLHCSRPPEKMTFSSQKTLIGPVSALWWGCTRLFVYLNWIIWYSSHH